MANGERRTAKGELRTAAYLRRARGGSWSTGSYGGSGARGCGVRYAACGMQQTANSRGWCGVRRSAKVRGAAGNRQQLATSELRAAGPEVAQRGRVKCQLPADGGCGEERAASTVRRTVCGKWVAIGGTQGPVRARGSGKRVQRMHEWRLAGIAQRRSSVRARHKAYSQSSNTTSRAITRSPTGSVGACKKSIRGVRTRVQGRRGGRRVVCSPGGVAGACREAAVPRTLQGGDVDHEMAARERGGRHAVTGVAGVQHAPCALLEAASGVWAYEVGA
ncbi:hypothetical protein GGX14DRAFT_632659 [Mycena pura]|uniref:Uncharacterized protein n=1 Tax=Mycena pura TaxID=153505 RepID=A0AAD6VC74_9AGAR|nr:hypothetical protein GGX14DRAFT_632659 [Mycena pura]